MSSINFVLLVLALTGLTEVVLGQEEPRVLPTDPAIILDTLYGKIDLNGPLKPSETLELFKRLVEEHKATLPADELEQVEYLYSVSHADESKCNYDTFEKLEKALITYAQFGDTILPYLKYYKQLLWQNVCRPTLQNQVANVVNMYDKDYVRELFLLTMINHLEDDEGLLNGLSETVASFIQYKFHDREVDLERFLNKEKFLKMYEEIIGGTCKNPLNDLAPMMRVYDLLFPGTSSNDEIDSERAKQMADELISGVNDGPTMLWISITRICRELVENDLQLISHDVRHILTKHVTMGPRIKSFFASLFNRD